MRLLIFEEKKQELMELFEIKWKTNNLQPFQFLSANLSKCMPSLTVEDHKSIYFDILSYRILQHIDTQFCDQFDGIDDFNEFNYDEIKKCLPALFVSYHLGSYKSAMAFLIKYNINIVLIADPTAYKYNKDKMHEQYLMAKKAFNSTSDLIMYPADMKDLTVQLMSKMGKGYSVLAFIDGNSGANGYFNRDNSQRISLFGQNIFVRNGLPTLSFYLKCPIIPMLSYYDENLKPKWKIYEPIIPVKGERKPGEYVKSSTEYLYSILEKALEKHYAQWEGWMFLQRYMDTEAFNNSIDISNTNVGIHDMFINPNVGLFTIEGKRYALNKENYKIMEITENVFVSIEEGNPEGMTLTQSDINLLYKNGIVKAKLHAAC